MKFLNIIQKVFKIARVLTVIAICLFFIAAGYELILVAIELLTHGSKAIDKHLIAHALEHLVHFVALGQKFPSFFTGTTYIGVLLGAVLVVVSLILKYGAELENNIKNNNSDKKDE